jgi:hypothetical protein
VHLHGEYGTFVVGICDGSEPLLSCGVPDLKFNVFVVGGDSFESEVDADGGHVVFVELVVCESEEEAALAD